MSDLYTLQASSLPASARLLDFYGVEGMSRPYRFDLRFSLAHAESLAFDLDAPLGRRATLTVNADDGTARQRFHGIVSAVESHSERADGAVYAAVLVPKLWELSLSRHSRVWVDQRVPDILEDVLRRAGLAGADYELRLSGRFTPREYVCQYRESDLDFLSRWMEQAGIYYFFEQGEDQEKLVLVNDKGSHASAGHVRYFATGSPEGSNVEGLRAFRCRAVSQPGRYKVTDYNPLTPTLPIADEQAAGGGDGHAVVRHAEGDALAPPDARRAAQVDAQGGRARSRECSGEGRAHGLVPGVRFDLEDHPRGDFNATWLVTEAEHRGTMGLPNDLTAGSYSVRLRGIAADTQFRAPARTPMPYAAGVETAVVDGAADGDYAQIDEHGRYLVRFHFDETSHPAGRCSARVRRTQPHAGEPEGWHLPLRKGTEVVVAFLGGDPDRPVIVGAVPNPLTPSVVTEENHTYDVLHTAGDNRVEVDDDEPRRSIVIWSPPQRTYVHLGAHHPATVHIPMRTHNTVASTDGSGLIHHGGDQDITVGGHKRERVVKAVKETYHANQTVEVRGDVTEEYELMQKTTVTNLCEEYYNGDHTTDVDLFKKEKTATQQTTIGTLEETHLVQSTTVTTSLTETADSHSYTASALSKQHYGTLTMNVTKGPTTVTSPPFFIVNAPSIEIKSPAGATILTGARVLKDMGKWFKCESTESEMVGFKMGVHASAKTLIGMKNEATVAAIGLYNVKIDLSATQFSAWAVTFKATGEKATATSLDINLSALKLLL
ncbi:MAG: type VI secretion system tip protein TssI/VgrG [Polyangiales bacterium]